MGVLNTHIFPLRMNANGFRVSKRMSKGNTQNATCASRSKSGSYRTLQIRTTYVLMWDRIEIVPLKIWYPQELHGVPKTLSLIFRNFSLIFLKSWRIQSLEKKTHAFLLCKGMNFPLRLGLSCSLLPLTATKLAMVLGESNIRLGVGLDFLLQHQARFPHLTQPKNPEKQVFLWTFAANLTTWLPSSNSGQQWLNRSWLRFLLSSIFLQWSSHWRRSARWPLAVSKMFDPKAFNPFIGTLRLCLLQEIWFVPISRTFLRSRHLHHTYFQESSFY